MEKIGGAGMKSTSEPFQPGISPKKYKEIMKKIEECEEKLTGGAKK